MALSIKNRIKKKNEIEKIFSQRRSLKGNFLLIRTIENSFQKPRFLVSVSVKAVAKATARNRLKRIISEFLRKNLLSIKEDQDIAIVVYRIGTEEDIIEDLKQLLNKLELLDK